MTPSRTFGPISVYFGPKGGRYPHCHTVYLQGRRRVLIDPGGDRKTMKSLRDGPGVDAVWLTHFHEDHLGSLDLFRDAELWVPEEEASFLEDPEAFMDAYGFMDGEVRAFFRDLLRDTFHFTPRRPDRVFSGEMDVDLGGLAVRVLVTPGHSPGHRSFWFPDQDLLFAGDYDLTGFGPYYGDASSNLAAVEASIDRLSGIPTAVTITCHGEGVFEGPLGDRWAAYRGKIDQREAMLEGLLARPRTREEIIAAHVVYGRSREPRDLYDALEWRHAEQHLEKWDRQGRLEVSGDRYVMAG